MISETKKLGNLGEEIAEKHLKKQGYKILERNFRYKRYGEIDIIAKKKENLSFVEVKTRKIAGNNPYNPEDNITYFKQKQLIKLSKIYLAKNNLTDISWQIDVIAIEIPPFFEKGGTKKVTLRYIEKAIEDFN